MKAFTVESLAERWCCCTDTIYTMIRKRQIRAFLVGNMLRISPEEVERYEKGESE